MIGFSEKENEKATAEACCRELAVTPMRHQPLAGWRYDTKCNYMITLVTEPRSGIFGRICEWGVDRTAEGKAVYDAWQMVEVKFPGVRATYNAIMPDHFHGIIYITADGAAELGEVVSFFAAEAERRIGRRVWAGLWRDSICLARGQLHRQIEYVLSNARRRWIKQNNPELFRKVMGFCHWRLERASETIANVGEADSWDFRRFARDPRTEGREFWNLETGEEIVKPRKANFRVAAFASGEPAGGGRQQVHDSKMVAGGRQQAHDSKTGAGERQQAHDSKGGSVVWSAMGNPFLLEAPLLVSVRISTLTPPERLEDLLAKILTKVERGAVVVSPWISPGEKRVKSAVIEAGGRVVQLLPEGMGRYYKPAGRDFDLCAGGRLLQLSPFAPRTGGGAGRERYGKARFEWLNFAARAMGDYAMGVSRAELAGGAGKTASARQQGGGWGETGSARQEGL